MKLLILVLLTLNSVFPDAKIAEKNEGYRLKFKAEENGKIILGEWLLGKDLQKKELSFYGSDGKQNSYQGISRIQIQRNEYSIMIHEYNSENNENFIYKAEFIPEKKLYDFRFLISPKMKRPKGKYANVQYDRRVYDTKGNLRIQEYYDSKNKPVLFNGISRTEYVWNKTDYLTEIKNLVCESPERDFEGNSCRLVNDDSGIAQNVSEYDSFGRKIFEKNYDQEKKLALDKYKNEASAVYSYENQSTSEIRKYGADGKPILDSRGVHKYIYTYNKSKKLTEMQFFGIENQPVQNLEGHSASRYEYDTDGRKISEEHFTAPGIRSSKNGIERREFSYDSVYADAVSAESFFRYSGQQKIPAADSEGIHSYRYSFSDYCIEGKTRNTIDSMDSETFKSKSYNEDRIRGYHASACRDSVTFIGLNGQPTQNSKGAVREEYVYSEFLFEKTAEVYYGKNFEYNPELQYTKYIIGTDYFTNHPNDAEFERIKFDRAGNQILKEKIGKDGKLSSRTVRKFDRFNNEILTEYWSSENELTQDTIPSVYVYSYDENCMNLKKSPKDCLAFLESYNFKREAVSLPNKPARVRKKYDHNGNIIFSEYFSSDGKPYAENGIFRSLQTYEKNGNKLKTEYFGKDGTLTGGTADKIAVITYRFNAACSEKKGQNNEECISTQEFFDHTEKAVESKDGVSKRVGTFDESGNRTSVYLLDQKGRLKADSEGIAKTKMEYDRICLLKNAKNSDCISLLEYFSADGKPTEKNGMAGKKVKYNENGNMIEFEIFRIDGTRAEDPVHKIAQSKYSGYDENCLKMKPEKDCFLEKTFFDRNDLPRERNDGIARIANVFDQNGFKVKTMFFDRKGFFADSHESGFSIVHYHYDQECADNFKIPDRCLRGLTYFNKDLKPALPTRGYSESYVTRSFYERFAEYKADLDSFGNIVGEIYYNDRNEIRSIVRQDTRLFRQDGRLKRKRVPDESLHSAKTTDYERLIPSRDPGKDGTLYNDNLEHKYHLLIKNSGTKDGSSFIYIVFDRFYRPVEVQFRRY